MDSPFSEQHWFGCLATGGHEPRGLMQQWKIVKFPLQLFRAMILPMCCDKGVSHTNVWRQCYTRAILLTLEQIASRDLKKQTELGNQWLCVPSPSMVAVQPRADVRPFDLPQSLKHRLWSHCTRDWGTVTPPAFSAAETQKALLRRSWNPSPEQDLTWPGVSLGPAWQFPSHQTGCAAALE